MDKNTFINLLRDETLQFNNIISDNDGSWVVKGFIDKYKTIYTISSDTKVISKILELYLFPKIFHFAQKYNLEIELTKEQNFYPDITFKDEEGNLFAVDLKSSYRKNNQTINGLTLGSFTGYFRERNSSKNTTHPYNAYKAHIVLGIIYNIFTIDERKCYILDQLDDIISTVKDFEFFVQEKWKIAIDRPGSGNTKNIGSVNRIKDLIAGNGLFSELGEAVFDDYWMHYLTRDMARAAQLDKPYYCNLTEYKKFKMIP